MNDKKVAKILKETYLDAIETWEDSVIDRDDASAIALSSATLLKYFMVAKDAEAWLKKHPYPKEMTEVELETALLNSVVKGIAEKRAREIEASIKNKEADLIIIDKAVRLLHLEED